MSEPGGQPASDNPVAAIQELGRAAGKALTALAGAASGDKLTALDCVFALDDALDQLTRILPILPTVEELADTGPRLAAKLSGRLTEVTEASARLSALRKDLESLGEAEQSLAEIAAEHAQLATRLAELEGISERATVLAGLRERVASLESATADAAATAADHESLAARLAAATGQLKSLTSHQLDALGSQIAQVITETASAGEALEQQQERKRRLDADLKRLAEDSDEVTKAVKTNLAALAAWRTADAAMAAGLDDIGSPEADSVLERVRGVLADLESRLATVEARLGPAFEAYVSAREDALRIRPLSGSSA